MYKYEYIIDLKKYNNNPISIDLKVKSNNSNKFKIIGFDKELNIKYFDYYYIKQNDFYLKIKLPIYPKLLCLYLYSDLFINENDISFFIYYDGNSLEETVLNLDLRYFIKFIYEFVKNYTILKTEELYYCENLDVGINYIFNNDRITSPMFIDCYDKIITVQKYKILKQNVNEIILSLLHEYSHCFLNKNPNSEIESDFNALINYIKLNFSEHNSFHMINGVNKRNPRLSNKVRKLFFKDNLIRLYKYKNKKYEQKYY